MLNIFKKLRREKMESKYLKYAIGEIFLVVIGILIALGINNWNESRKERQLLEGYLEAIQKNIQSDTVDINSIQKRYKALHQAAMEHLALAFQNTYNEEVLSRSINVLGESYVLIDQSGFEAFKNSEVIKDLQGSALLDALFAYYNSYQDAYQQEISLNTFIENMEVRLYDTTSDEILDVLKWGFGNQYEGNIELSQPKDDVLRKLAFNPYLLGIIQRMADEDSLRYIAMLSNAEKVLQLIKVEIQ